VDPGEDVLGGARKESVAKARVQESGNENHGWTSDEGESKTPARQSRTIKRRGEEKKGSLGKKKKKKSYRERVQKSFRGREHKATPACVSEKKGGGRRRISNRSARGEGNEGAWKDRQGRQAKEEQVRCGGSAPEGRRS